MATYGVLADVSDERIIELIRLKEGHRELQYLSVLYGDEVNATNSGLVIAQVDELLPRVIHVRSTLVTLARIYLQDGRKRSDTAYPMRWKSDRFGQCWGCMSLGEIGAPLDHSLVVNMPTPESAQYTHSLIYWATAHEYYYSSSAEIAEAVYGYACE